MPTMPTSNTVTMTVNLDKTASLSRQNFGSQGEDIEITVVVPVGLSGSGYDAYIDFIQPDGLSYFKGPYDCSSGTFSFFIGVLDSLMDKDGDLSWQFLLAETAGSVRTVKWAANQYKNPIYASIGATSSAILPYVPQMVYPASYLASLITLVDAAGRYTAIEVEAALAEIAGSGRTTQTVKANADAITNLAGAGRTTETVKANADAIAVLQAPPLCMLSKSAAQAIGTATYTAIIFDTEIKDTATMHDNGTNPTRITIPVTGQYLATACVEFAVNATGFRVALLRKNGTTVTMSQVLSSGTLSDRLNVSAIIDCAAGEYLELFVWQNSGGDLNVDATAAYSPTLSVVKIV